MKQKRYPKGNKAVILVIFLHLLLIAGFIAYVCCVKFPVILWDDGMFLNRKFISASKDFFISTAEIYVGIPLLICIVNAIAVKYISFKYLGYIQHIQETCGRAEKYFQETYPEQHEMIAKTTYFASRIEVLEKDAQSIRPEKMTRIFSNLRQCGSMEKEFKDLCRRCEAFRMSHGEKEFAQMLRKEFGSYLTYSAFLLNEYYPNQMQTSFSELDTYLNAVAKQNKPVRYFKDNPYDTDTTFLLSELYAPLRVLAEDLKRIAEYLYASYREILAENSISGLEMNPLPEEFQNHLNQTVTAFRKIPESRQLLELSVLKDKKSQKKYLSCLEKFRNFPVMAGAYDQCIGLYSRCITDMEHWMLEELLSHYRIVENAYRMDLPEDSGYLKEFREDYELLKETVDSEEFRWHLYYLHIFSETQHRKCDVSLSSYDTQNLQCHLDRIRKCAENINQAVRKDELA